MVEKILHELFIICLLSTFVIFVCHKIKIPPIVGFLITGALCGPSTFGLVSDLDAVNTLSEIGIVFLLFTIGLEISIGELIRLRKSVFFGGLIQVLITIIIFWFLASGSGTTQPEQIFSSVFSSRSRPQPLFFRPFSKMA